VWIRAIERADLGEVARVHLAAFPKSALGELGHEAVRRNYLWLLEGPHECLALGAFDGPRLVGFCFGGKFNGALTGFLHANRWYLAKHVITHPWLLAGALVRDRVRTAVKLLAARKRPAPPAPARPRSYSILAIAVDPAVQGTGAGKLLMRDHEVHARGASYPQMHLCVAPTNAQAIRFYERLGWEKSIADGAWAHNGLMTKQLSTG
jgi:ribosomal protein S18 acetylase RimI-like enzyme